MCDCFRLVITCLFVSCILQQMSLNMRRDDFFGGAHRFVLHVDQVSVEFFTQSMRSSIFFRKHHCVLFLWIPFKGKRVIISMCMGKGSVVGRLAI